MYTLVFFNWCWLNWYRMTSTVRSSDDFIQYKFVIKSRSAVNLKAQLISKNNTASISHFNKKDQSEHLEETLGQDPLTIILLRKAVNRWWFWTQVFHEGKRDPLNLWFYTGAHTKYARFLQCFSWKLPTGYSWAEWCQAWNRHHQI